MEITFKEIINCQKDKTAWIIANGPTTKNNLKRLIDLTKNEEERSKHVFFICNDFDLMLENIGYSIKQFKPEYWVVANDDPKVEKYYSNFNKVKEWNGKLLYADSIDLSKNVDKLLEIDYLPYDQKHFNGLPCIPNGYCPCCIQLTKKLKAKRKTIQEEFQLYTNKNFTYTPGCTIALHMLSFAIMMGCNKINISGVDLNYKFGYFDQKSQNSGTFDTHLHIIMHDFAVINKAISDMPIQVRNLSNISPIKNIFSTGEPL